MKANEVVPETVGKGLTPTATAAVLEQPLISIPVTMYIVEVVGETLTEGPVKSPGCQRYALAPVADKVAEAPMQIAVADVVATTVGKARTPTDTVAVFVQPFKSVPKTVYVVLILGETDTNGPDKLPGCQR